MKKIGNILLLIGAIMSFISAGILVVVAIVLFVFASPALTNTIVQGVTEGTIHSSFTGDPNEVAAAIQFTFGFTGAILMVVTIPTVADGVISLLATKRQTQGWYIATLVLAILSGSILNLIGSILGIAEPYTQHNETL